MQSDGIKRWEYKMEGLQSSIFTDALVSPSGEILMTGFAIDSLNQTFSLLSMINPDGQELWRSFLDIAEYGRDMRLFLNADGTIKIFSNREKMTNTKNELVF